MRHTKLELYGLVSFALSSFFPLEVCFFDCLLTSSIHLLVAFLVLTFVHTSTGHALQSIIFQNVLGQPDHPCNLHHRGAFKLMITTGCRSGHGTVLILDTALMARRLSGGNGGVVITDIAVLAGCLSGARGNVVLTDPAVLAGFLSGRSRIMVPESTLAIGFLVRV